MAETPNAGAGGGNDAGAQAPASAPASPEPMFACDGCSSTNLRVEFYTRGGKRMARWWCRDCKATGRENL